MPDHVIPFNPGTNLVADAAVDTAVALQGEATADLAAVATADTAVALAGGETTILAAQGTTANLAAGSSSGSSRHGSGTGR